MVNRKRILMFSFVLLLIGILILIYQFKKQLPRENPVSEEETLRKLAERYQDMLKLATRKRKIVTCYKLKDFLYNDKKKIALFKFYEKVDDLKEDSCYYKIIKMRSGFIDTSWNALMGLPDSKTRLLVSYMDNGAVFHYFMPNNDLAHNELEEYFNRMIGYIVRFLYPKSPESPTYTLVISKESFECFKLEKDNLAVKIGILRAVCRFSQPIEIIYEI